MPDEPQKDNVYLGATTGPGDKPLSEEDALFAERAHTWAQQLVENAFELSKKAALQQTCIGHELLLESTLAFDVILDERIKLKGAATVGFCRLCKGRAAQIQAEFTDIAKPPGPKLIVPE